MRQPGAFSMMDDWKRGIIMQQLTNRNTAIQSSRKMRDSTTKQVPTRAFINWPMFLLMRSIKNTAGIFEILSFFIYQLEQSETQQRKS